MAQRDGTLTAWEFHNYNSGRSGIDSPYNVPSQHTAFHQAHSPLRHGSYRALASTANNFARESHMDDLACAAGLGPLEFRLKNLSDARVRAVIQAAADAFGWASYHKQEHHGVGIAAGTEKGGYIATCAEVSIEPSTGRVQVVRAVSAFECGAIINPDHLKNQVEGALIMGLGGALFEEIEYDGGRITNPRFSRYRVPRFRDTPELKVVLLDRKDLPSAGAGETPIIAIAPAIGNAIFDATGLRCAACRWPRGGSRCRVDEAHQSKGVHRWVSPILQGAQWSCCSAISVARDPKRPHHLDHAAMQRPVGHDHAAVDRQLAAMTEIERTARDVGDRPAGFGDNQCPSRVVPDPLPIVDPGWQVQIDVGLTTRDHGILGLAVHPHWDRQNP